MRAPVCPRGPRHVVSRSRLPITPRPPVRSTKRQTASTFGPIEPAENSPLRRAAGGARHRALVRRAVAVVLNIRGQHQRVGAELDREQRGGEVLVDHRLHAVMAVGVLDDGSRRPRAHHQIARIHEALDCASGRCAWLGQRETTRRTGTVRLSSRAPPPGPGPALHRRRARCTWSERRIVHIDHDPP